MWWVGCGDPYAQGVGQCVFASHIVRALLTAAGIEAEPLTVKATVHSPDGTSATIGVDKPRLRTSPLTRRRIWTGHEAIHVPQWNLVVDPTLFQVAADLGSATLLAPALLRLRGVTPSALRPTDTFDGDLLEPGWRVEYAVVRPSRTYRDDPMWRWQEGELKRGVDYGIMVLQRDGLLR